MAFTAEEEATLRQMINAYKNGKGIKDLDEATLGDDINNWSIDQYLEMYDQNQDLSTKISLVDIAVAVQNLIEGEPL